MPRKPSNRIGEVYGELTVVRSSTRRTGSGNAYWWCLCNCGKQREVSSDLLSNKIRQKKNVIACKECSKKLSIESIHRHKHLEEMERRKKAAQKRIELIGQVPKHWLLLPLTDAHARELGRTLFFRGCKCLNGHISPYRINGGCLACSKEKAVVND